MWGHGLRLNRRDLQFDVQNALTVAIEDLSDLN